MAERSNAAVLKTVDCNRSGGSNPSLSALLKSRKFPGFSYLWRDAGEVERVALEMRSTRKGTGGSNPSLSAQTPESPGISGTFCV